MKLSDIIIVKRGKFEYKERINSQNRLIDRLEEQFEKTKQTEFRHIANEVKALTNQNIASVTYLEMIFDKILLLCNENKIEVT